MASIQDVQMTLDVDRKSHHQALESASFKDELTRLQEAHPMTEVVGQTGRASLGEADRSGQEGVHMVP